MNDQERSGLGLCQEFVNTLYARVRFQKVDDTIIGCVRQRTRNIGRRNDTGRKVLTWTMYGSG